MLEMLTGRRLFDAKTAAGMALQGGATGGEMASTLQARSDTPYSHLSYALHLTASLPAEV
jgi:hypothetical protein